MLNLRWDWETLDRGDWETVLLQESSRENRPANAIRNAQMRLHLLESDLKSLRISFADYLTAQREVDSHLNPDAKAVIDAPWWPNEARARMFHHAKVFVVCMRRFARLMEACRSKKREYPHEVGEAIDLSWRKTKSFLEDYRQARDAIEHIDGEVNGYNMYFLNLWGDQLEVVKGRRAAINAPALDTVENAWAGIVAAIMRPVEARVRHALVQMLLYELATRLQQIGGSDSPNFTSDRTAGPPGLAATNQPEQ